MKKNLFALTALFPLVGCATYSATPTSFTRTEEIRREITGALRDAKNADLIAELEARGFSCRSVYNEQFSDDKEQEFGPLDYVLCERGVIGSDVVAQAAVVLDDNIPTGQVLVNCREGTHKDQKSRQASR